MASYSFFKSIADRCMAFVLLVLSVPLLILVASIVYVKFGRPVFYTQLRPGFRGTSFCIFKFRSMNDRRDSCGNLLSDAVRLTSFGKFLRATSIDELPGLINVLRGDMSFVGPRPLLMHYLPLYSPEQARRHDVKPGFSGWAQINGRNALSWTEKFRLDVWYVDNQSFWLDIYILFITVWKVIRREGISASGEATMSPFMGSASSSEAR
jgi:sugar transferase EpsL